MNNLKLVRQKSIQNITKHYKTFKTKKKTQETSFQLPQMAEEIIEILSDEEEIISVDEVEVISTGTHGDGVEIIDSSPPLRQERQTATKRNVLDNILDSDSDDEGIIIKELMSPIKKRRRQGSISSSPAPKTILAKTHPQSLFVDSTSDPIADMSHSQPLPILRFSQSPPRSPEVIIGEHNIILSSPGSNSDTDNDSLFNIKLSTSKSEPGAPRQSDKSSSFLDKFNQIDSANKQKYALLRDKMRKNQLSSSSPVKSKTAPNNIPPTAAKMRNPTDPIRYGNLERPATLRTQTFTTGLSKNERALAKEQKEQERRRSRILKELNKVTRSKNELLSEMIITIPQHFESEFKVDEFSPIQVKFTPSKDDYYDDSITWKRKINSKYIKQTDSFEPCEFDVITEGKFCVIYKIDKFIDLIETDKRVVEKLNEIREQTRAKFDNFFIILIGLESYLSKLKAKQEREYQAAVRTQLGTQPTKTSRSKHKGLTNLSIDDIQSLISRLEINGYKVFPTKNPHETVLWLISLTYTISSGRYDKYERNQDLANIGTIKSGIDKQDTYERILTHFKSMNKARAQVVMRDYPTVRQLYTGMVNGRSLGVGGNLAMGIKRLFTSVDENELLKDLN